MRRTISLLLFAALSVSCGAGGLPATAVCKQTSDCAAGLQCLAIETVEFTTVNGQDAGCTEQPGGSTCSITCTTDADCASLKPPSGVTGTWKCFSGCGAGSSVCGLAG